MVNEFEKFRGVVEGEVGFVVWKEDFGWREVEIDRVEVE